MSKSKITKWIDRNNYKVCLVINRKFYRRKAKGALLYFFIDITLYPFLVARVLLVFLQLFRFNSSLLQTHPNQKAISLAHKATHYISVFFGLQYFVKKEYTSLHYEETVPLNELWFNTSELPKVSIIIPVHNQLSYTLNCLRALKLNLPEDIAVEIVVINDASTDSTPKQIGDIKGVRIINNLENIGFLKSCRKAIENSKGEYICLLNNDTMILKGWLEALVTTIEKDSSVGLVGSKLIHPSGLLQEAGGIVYNDGSRDNYGGYKDPNYFAYNYLREVDYCTGISILFKRTDYNELNGLDIQYAPACYGDTDFCLSIRHLLNKKVIYQPLSESVYLESSSLKKDKPNCEINKAKFFKKWEEILKTYLPTSTNETSARKYTKDKTLVIIDSYLPRFDKESGSHRIYELIKIFKAMNFHLIFIPHNGEPEQPYYNLLTGNGIEVVIRYIGWLTFKKHIVCASRNAKYIWACRPRLNKKYGFIRKHNLQAKWFYDTVDLHYIRLEREASLLQSKKKLVRAKRYKKLELALAKRADITVCITDVEQKLLQTEGISNTIVIPNIHSQPLNIVGNTFEESKDLLFVGSYDHPPNVDAVIWLCNDIMPAIWEQDASIKLHIIGNNPKEEVLSLANDKIEVHGYVENLQPFFNSCRIFVAPLRYGAGMKGKIGQSLSFGLPTITTDIGAEGMGLEHQKNILIANNANDFIKCLTELYHSKKLWEELRNNSILAIQDYTPSVVKQKLESIFKYAEDIHNYRKP